MKVTTFKTAKQFERLKRAKTKETISICLLSKHVYLGKTNQNNLCLVVEISKNSSCEVFAKKIGKILLYFIKNKELKISNKARRADVVVIELLDEILKTTFLGFIYAFLQKTKISKIYIMSPKEIEEYLLDWVSLFQNVKELSAKEKIGLWGELYFISQIKNPDKVIEKWHGPEQKVFDFVTKNESLDVKTGLSTTEHHFRKKQIAKENIFFISIRAEKSNKGNDLESIIKKITNKVVNKDLFNSKLAFLGYYNSSKDNTKYKSDLLRWLASNAIPQPRKIDNGVNNYEFISETSGVPEIPLRIRAQILKRLSN